MVLARAQSITDDNNNNNNINNEMNNKNNKIQQERNNNNNNKIIAFSLRFLHPSIIVSFLVGIIIIAINREGEFTFTQHNTHLINLDFVAFSHKTTTLLFGQKRGGEIGEDLLGQ